MKFKVKRTSNPITASQYVGDAREITLDMSSRVLAVHDGVTPGGSMQLGTELYNSDIEPVVEGHSDTLGSFNDLYTTLTIPKGCSARIALAAETEVFSEFVVVGTSNVSLKESVEIITADEDKVSGLTLAYFDNATLWVSLVKGDSVSKWVEAGTVTVNATGPVPLYTDTVGEPPLAIYADESGPKVITLGGTYASERSVLDNMQQTTIGLNSAGTTGYGALQFSFKRLVDGALFYDYGSAPRSVGLSSGQTQTLSTARVNDGWQLTKTLVGKHNASQFQLTTFGSENAPNPTNGYSFDYETIMNTEVFTSVKSPDGMISRPTLVRENGTSNALAVLGLTNDGRVYKLIVNSDGTHTASVSPETALAGFTHQTTLLPTLAQKSGQGWWAAFTVKDAATATLKHYVVRLSEDLSEADAIELPEHAEYIHSDDTGAVVVCSGAFKTGYFFSSTRPLSLTNSFVVRESSDQSRQNDMTAVTFNGLVTVYRNISGATVVNTYDFN